MRTLIATLTAAMVGLVVAPAAFAVPATGWGLTVYATVLEANHQGGASVSVFRCLHNDPAQGADSAFPLGSHPQEFVELASAAQQGSGRFVNRNVLNGFHYTGPGTGCGALSDVPLTSTGTPAIAWQTAAGGADAFPALGAIVRITACGTATLPSVCPFVTGAKWEVDDRRGQGKQLALYIGDENAAATFSSPDATVDTSPTTGPAIRIAGPDRLDTAVVASQSRFGAGTAKAVVISRSDDFADALAGTALAVAKVGPLLLTPPNGLDARTDLEINRVLPSGGPVYILGGTSAVSTAVSNAISAEGFAVTRIGGPNRFATATMIADAVGTPNTIMLATGLTPADALAGGAAAAHTGGVVILTSGSSMPPESSTYLGQHKSVAAYALGGPAATADPAATPLVGADRYATAVLVATQFFQSPAVVGIASGQAFADALSGGTAMGSLGGPLLLATSPLPQSVHDYLQSIHQGVARADIFGGIAVISEDLLTAVDTAA
jgi:putative cell wall-binding protein